MILTIAVLIALLATALPAVVRASRDAACLSNLRGLVQSVTAYAGSHRDQLPPPWTAGAPQAFGLDVSGPGAAGKALVCPEDPERAVAVCSYDYVDGVWGANGATLAGLDAVLRGGSRPVVTDLVGWHRDGAGWWRNGGWLTGGAARRRAVEPLGLPGL